MHNPYTLKDVDGLKIHLLHQQNSPSLIHDPIPLLHDYVYDSVNTKDFERMEQGCQHDTLNSLVVKVLPLFNGEGLMCNENLNDLIIRYVNDRQLHSLYEDINELLESEMFTLNGNYV
ncbi:17242_t:CDS:2 [Funneliformis caledonium]|uniref:17242_t:CDS:1 n=1 Tax=Funneliformis caledonium TaxID=1117310 RepID=A0A9N9GBF6_9GLOM|nr:17242_t:CDS:2 [Funneliformis caledonium]